MARDVFRRAQVHFDIYGRYLRLRGPAPPALMHWSYPLPLRFAGVPNLYSVLDLIPLLQPDLTPIAQARAARLLHRLRHEAAHLVTISETSRREIITTLGWPAERVTNTFLAVDVPEQNPVQVQMACAAAGLQGDGYFLHVGTVERRKNIARLLAAYRTSGSTRALVLAGPDGWGAAEELAGVADLLVAPGAAAQAASGRPRVVRIDWIERPALLGLMQEATAVLAPSLAEGFGLPAIEAMALGTPALTSRCGAPQEIAGNAALLVDPLNVHDIAAGITALDRDIGLRATLSAAGKFRAKAFAPAAYAASLAALYGAVLNRARAGG
jgi:glycosyltransferase involved in cell wall biosynthesis